MFWEALLKTNKVGTLIRDGLTKRTSDSMDVKDRHWRNL